MSICFKETPNTLRARGAFGEILKSTDFRGNDTFGWAYGVEKETGDVIFFFPITILNNLGSKKDFFLTRLRDSWIEAKFEIIDEKNLEPNEFAGIGFPCICFKLRSLIDLETEEL